jgi:GGDEF domain-containing protein
LGQQRSLPVVPAARAGGDVAAVTARTAARSRLAGRRAVSRKPREVAPAIPRQHPAIATGPAALGVLRSNLQERLADHAPADSDAADQDPAERAFSLVVVEVAALSPAATDHRDGRDRLLTALGSRLADVTRPGDLVVHPAGDRFVLVLSGVRNRYGRAVIRRRIADVLSRPVLVDGRPVRTAVSVGVLPAAPGDTIDDLLGRLGQTAIRDRRSARRLRDVGRSDLPV